MQYLKVPKHYYLYIQGEQSKYFFVIITGRVCLRIRKKVQIVNETLPNNQQSKKKVLLRSKSNYIIKCRNNVDEI